MYITGLRYYDAVKHVNSFEGVIHIPAGDYSPPPAPEISFYNDLTDDTISYYLRNGIDKDKLEAEGIKSVRRVQWSSRYTWYPIAGRPIMYWPIGDGGKLYNPLAIDKAHKWRSFNVPKDDLDGLDAIDFVDVLYVVSSKKDKMLWGYFAPAIAPHGSETNVAIWEVMKEKLLSKCKHLVFAFDGDDAGFESSARIVAGMDSPSRVHYLDMRQYHETFPGTKDPAGVCWEYGRDMTQVWIENIHYNTKRKLGLI